MTIHWYRADVTRPTHPKIKKLARRLGVTRMHAIGIHEVLCVIPAVAGRSDGFLGSMDAEDLAIAVDWEGDHEELLDTLVALAIVDRDSDGSLYVHGFAERATKEAAQRERDRDRKRAKRRADGESVAEDEMSELCPADTSRTPDGHLEMSGGNSARTNERTNGEDRARESGGDVPVADSVRSAASAVDAPTERRDTPVAAPPSAWGDIDEDLLDSLSDAGAQEAVEIYNAHRHPSLPAWDLVKLGVPAGLLYTMKTDAARERRDKSAPPWPMHRRSGWVAFAKRTHSALWLHEPGQRYDLAWWFRGARQGAVACEGYERRQRLAGGGSNGFDIVRRAAGSQTEPVKQKAPPTRERPRAPWEERTDGRHG